jgi:hypothetical protein
MEDRMRLERKSRRVCCLVVCASIANVVCFASVHGQEKEECPNQDNRYCPLDDGRPLDGSRPCNFKVGTVTDSKGGKWKYTCTNESEGGDFVWRYDKEGEEKGPKDIGRCVYQGGRNTWHYIRDPDDPKQILMFKQTVQNRKYDFDTEGNKIDRGPGNERTIHIFDKELNSGVKILETRVKNEDGTRGPWTEQERRPFTSLSVSHDSGGIPVEPEPAAYVTELSLAATIRRPNLNVLDIRWRAFDFEYEADGLPDPPFPPPVLRPGDAVHIAGLSLTNVLNWDPRYQLMSVPGGIDLMAVTHVPLFNDEVLLTIRRPGSKDLYYAVHAQGALEFLQAVLAGAPMEMELWEMPDYASTAGMIDLPPFQAPGPFPLP